jgi:type I restriction enzyme S subunit
LNQHLFKVTSKLFPKWYYFGWINEHLPEFQAIAADKATTMGHIRRLHLTAAKVVVPPDPLLKALTAIQEPILDRVIQNRVESRELEELRNALVAPLLSGDVAITTAERIVAEAI